MLHSSHQSSSSSSSSSLFIHRAFTYKQTARAKGPMWNSNQTIENEKPSVGSVVSGWRFRARSHIYRIQYRYSTSGVIISVIPSTPTLLHYTFIGRQPLYSSRESSSFLLTTLVRRQGTPPLTHVSTPLYHHGRPCQQHPRRTMRTIVPTARCKKCWNGPYDFWSETRSGFVPTLSSSSLILRSIVTNSAGANTAMD
jgi:hypothetical protein